MIPLACEASPLDAAELGRYARQLTMENIGLAGQLRLKAARVLVVGVGGLGSPVITYLARAGVGTIGVIDDDQVAKSNLHRQIIHDDLSIGKHKVDSALTSIARINPHVYAIAHHQRLQADNWRQIVPMYDVVVDGTDDFATRYLVSDATTELGLPCVWGTVLDTYGQLSTFWVNSPEGVTLRDLYPEEPPASEVSCASAGVLGPLCGVIASWMAAETIKLIVGFGQTFVGRLLCVDALDGSTREVAIRRLPDAQRANRQLGKCDSRLPPESVDAFRWIEATELQRALQEETPGEFILLDVRDPWEREIARIEGSIGIPLGDLDAETISRLADAPIVVHCHGDTRARRALEELRKSGRHDTRVLRGGIDAWAAVVDLGVARY
ncbi:adenylyltransferase/sulfurtransferase MoeZ [Rhodococcus erythropolis]|uniref:ThiF family adenylyltransferase n=1 Tax=Rhodococcus erythropolis TaxID=1833 RepID=UPI001C9B253D|nr:ThiF family adenylyltransferase [Rhodococcus erythropolis]MBY6382488.1 adenylyltransferase/sulfurtransferase MoeZ [Rhodococcus erythropolis]